MTQENKSINPVQGEYRTRRIQVFCESWDGKSTMSAFLESKATVEPWKSVFEQCFGALLNDDLYLVDKKTERTYHINVGDVVILMPGNNISIVPAHNFHLFFESVDTISCDKPDN